MGLGNLRDKLLEAGLVSEEDARKVARETEAAEAKAAARKRRQRAAQRDGKGGQAGPNRRGRAERPASELGLELTPEEKAAAQAKQAVREQKALADRERQANRRRAKAERKMAEDVRRVAFALSVEPRGDAPFFFQNRKGKIQRMLLDETLREQIERGELAIIEDPLPHAIAFALVPREGAEAVLKIDPRAVRFYNRAPDEFVGGLTARPPDR